MPELMNGTACPTRDYVGGEVSMPIADSGPGPPRASARNALPQPTTGRCTSARHVRRRLTLRVLLDHPSRAGLRCTELKRPGFVEALASAGRQGGSPHPSSGRLCTRSELSGGPAESVWRDVLGTQEMHSTVDRPQCDMFLVGRDAAKVSLAGESRRRLAEFGVDE